MTKPTSFLHVFCLAIFIIPSSLADSHDPTIEGDKYSVGIARRDITPDYPIRLSGFGGRRLESEGVRQPIVATAMAIADAEKRPAVLVTIDNLGISTKIRMKIADELAKDGVHLDRLAISASHTHTAPMLKDVCPTLFGVPIPDEHQAHIDQYTDWLTSELVGLIRQAIADMRPSTMNFGVGKVTFASNRRTAGGPVDHDLPLLVIRDLDNKPVAIYVNYACHCVTLSDNKISGDWAGYAREAIERQFPGTLAMVSIGCGADANPSSGVTGDRGDIAAMQGAEIGTEVARMIQGFLQPVRGPLTTVRESIQLPLKELPTREQWDELAKREDAIGYHARFQIAKLDRGEALMLEIDYEIQTWKFGDSLAMLFLPGEVVVDYALRIKKPFDGGRVFINAYSNDSPGYVPSERILREGGYEGGGAMTYYGIPTSYAEGLEQNIVDVVERQLGNAFRRDFDPDKTNASLPLSGQQSALVIQVPPGLRADLGVAEPLVVDPVAIDFGPDGRLWVAEMNDYPAGESGNFEPGGRIRVLRDRDQDGQFDTSTIFAEGLPFPTGITVWRDGVLVCAAPSIIYMPDRDHDDHADEQQVLYTGFGTDNYQARVNSLTYGLDGWLYGSCGLFGGRITSTLTGKEFELGDRDFRIRPDEGLIEPAIGRTQQGRVRDDWDNWFGCDNSDLGRHYPIPDHYLGRNPHVAPAVTAVHLPRDATGQQLFPINANAQRFKLSGSLGQTTAACGIGIYRDDLLGSEYQGDLFTCEPVNLVVHRMKLAPEGSSFGGRRPATELEREFLASTDNWFRPVQVRTGPDGALWVVDMCRFIIEHPRWIPAEDLARLDARAGNRLGRLYRIVPSNWIARPFPRFDERPLEELPNFLETENGWQREIVAQLIRWKFNSNPPRVKNQKTAREAAAQSDLSGNLTRMAKSRLAETRATAMCLLSELGLIDESILQAGLQDKHPGVRRQAVRLCEPLLQVGLNAPFAKKLMSMVNDENGQVRLQLACTLGQYRDSGSGEALFALASRDWDDAIMSTAVLSSINDANCLSLLEAVVSSWKKEFRSTSFVDFVDRVFRMAYVGNDVAMYTLLSQVCDQDKYELWEFSLGCHMLRARQEVDSQEPKKLGSFAEDFMKRASELAGDDDQDEAIRMEAVSVLGISEARREDDLEILTRLVRPLYSTELAAAALRRMAALDNRSIAQSLLSQWNELSPTTQTAALQMLLTRPVWQNVLVDQIESKNFSANALSASQREQLSTREGSDWQRRVRRLWSDLENTSRAEVVSKFAEVANLTGNIEQGKLLFDKRCAVCHRLRERGYAVGPDLDMVASKSIQYLLTEVLAPNRNVDSRYSQYVALTNDGRVINGLLAEESSTALVFRGQENKETTVLRSELESLKSTGKSLMPEGLEKDVSAQDLADIFAFLASVPVPYKTFEGNVPQKVFVHDDQLALLAKYAEIRGENIVFETPFQNIGYWYGQDDFVTWQIDQGSLGECDVYLDYACDDSAAGNRFVIEIGEKRIEAAVAGTGAWSEYKQIKVGTAHLTDQISKVVVRPEGVPKSAILDLRGVYLVASGKPMKRISQFKLQVIEDDSKAIGLSRKE